MESTLVEKRIKPLTTEFERADLHWQLIRRVGDVAIFEGRADGRALEWEIIIVRIKRYPALHRGRSQWTHYEAYPTTPEWGRYGWTQNDQHRAWIKFNEICAKST